ncbi:MULTISPECIES: thioredoxin domain-containing protein [unclassified Campylobacter]|uniref:thioredoxin domain-containing protein n=1 Tax=unclassified Campylobacter TaxID=2593542 RepID=UPI001BD9B309|nr:MULTISPECIES: thioredoxin domain-containing protein [unclassified Campylobacter]MBZ7976020.1 thioredoxin domain-containing protein [Campylobacter sp. RM12637]MBZ7979821.1 thioredoxin domain-containing protein [Campylobacter sp. RM12642]MBZ7982070.1 thioredoxin domain-containing protein [Campylobacter sp. RM12640]MBZ7983468.1 thioredoxin domain-containing protein [Campylobacter sp. RM12647]MBZ7988874.1 thioredoxin domain-containing protein [Campylobacter sp. RM12635]MBZ7991014.1 thioredoxin
MLKQIKKLALVLLVSSNLFALSEGVEYNVLENPIPNSDNSLTEIWSYQCSHCYLHHNHNTLGLIKEQLKDLDIRLMMVKTWGKFGQEMANLLAYAHYQDEKNKISLIDKNSLYDKISSVYFVEMFKNKSTWNNNPDEFYKSGLSILGISKKKLESFLQSPEGKYLLSSTDIANEIANTYGTPTFIVNGKYVINLAYAKSPQMLIDMINELSKK